MTDWLSSAATGSATARATKSVLPPAGNGTSSLMGRDGQGCAMAGVTAASVAAASKRRDSFKGARGIVAFPSDFDLHGTHRAV